MEFKVKHIGYAAIGLGSAYLVYRLINKGFTFVAKYPRLYALVTKGESKTYNDYNFYNFSGLKSNVAGSGSKYPLLKRPLTTYTVGQVKAMQSQARYGENGQLWATGRYQIIPSTLIASKPALNNYLTAKVADTDANLKAAALAVAQIWSSVGQPSNNKSYYGENAVTSTYDVQKVLKSYR